MSRLLNADELALRLAVPKSWIYRAARKGTLPCVKLGRYTRFDAERIEAWIAEQQNRGGG